MPWRHVRWSRGMAPHMLKLWRHGLRTEVDARYFVPSIPSQIVSSATQSLLQWVLRLLPGGKSGNLIMIRAILPPPHTSFGMCAGWPLLFFYPYLLTPWRRSTVLLEKLTVPQLIKKFPAFYRTRIFITAFTSARHLSLSWASSIQSISPNPISWRSILM